MDWIMHGNTMTDECIGKLADSKIPLVPTLALLANGADWGHLAGVDQHMRDIIRYGLDATAETLHRAHAAGVKLLMGTRLGLRDRPLRRVSRARARTADDLRGLSTAEAIRSGTSDAAVVMGLPGEVGVMRPGAYADLLMVNGNPLENIRLLQDKAEFQVFKGGRAVGEDPHGARRWHNERAQIVLSTGVTYDLVTAHCRRPARPRRPNRRTCRPCSTGRRSRFVARPGGAEASVLEE